MGARQSSLRSGGLPEGPSAGDAAAAADAGPAVEEAAFLLPSAVHALEPGVEGGWEVRVTREQVSAEGLDPIPVAGVGPGELPAVRKAAEGKQARLLADERAPAAAVAPVLRSLGRPGDVVQVGARGAEPDGYTLLPVRIAAPQQKPATQPLATVKLKLKVKVGGGHKPSKKAAAAVAMAAKDRLAWCFARHMPRKAKGTMKLSVFLDVEGRRAAVRVSGKDPFKGAEPTPCLLAAAGSWEFGPPAKRASSEVRVALKYATKPAPAGAPVPPSLPEVRVVVDGGGTAVSRPGGGGFSVKAVGKNWFPGDVAGRLRMERAGFPQGTRVRLKASGPVPWGVVAALADALAEPVGGAPAFPPVHIEAP